MPTALTAFVIVLGFAVSSKADTITFTLSSPDDLDHVIVGHAFQVDVNVSGLTSPADTLGAILTYSNASNPTDPTPGPIVPDPIVIDPDIPPPFTGVTFPDINLVSGSFFDVFIHPPITADHGLLFSFHLTAGSLPGSGSVNFFNDPEFGLQVFTDGATPVVGGPLNFTIVPDTVAAVPTPTAVWGGVALMGLLGLAQLLRRRFVMTI